MALSAVAIALFEVRANAERVTSARGSRNPIVPGWVVFEPSLSALVHHVVGLSFPIEDGGLLFFLLPQQVHLGAVAPCHTVDGFKHSASSFPWHGHVNDLKPWEDYFERVLDFLDNAE